MSKTVAELRAELRAAEQAESEAKRVAAQAVKAKLVFTIRRNDSSFDKILDESCVLYRITGITQNKDELAAVGREARDGGMNYLFNIATGRLVCSMGGGNVYVKTGQWSSDKPDWPTIRALEAFIVANPDGGDVTHIVPHGNWT
jgi:hypothetical protein